jgi:DNA-binding LacI/PurR family transcriptional regulator
MATGRRIAMVTIQDVAKAAGVSPMTVSNVINAHPHVAAGTRDKVMRAISALDYRVNVAARNLRTGRTGTIGMAVPDIDSRYFSHLVAEVVREARARGYRLAVEQTDAAREAELETARSSRNRLYDGLLLSTVGLRSSDAELLQLDFPVVLLGEGLFGGPHDHIAMPNVAGSRLAVEHLIEQGCRRIAMFNLPPTGTDGHDLRYQGYRQALDDAGLPADPDLYFPVASFGMEQARQSGRDAAASHLEFDGAFCASDAMAIGVMRGLADAGRRIPADVKVVGFDDIPEAQFLTPSLTTISPDHSLTASRAVEFLIERIEGRAPEVPREITTSFELVVRESSA